MFGREPAVIIAALVALIQAAGIFVFADPMFDAGLFAVPLATFLGGIMTRRKVIPVETVKDAGISPREVQHRAKDPTVPRREE